MNRSECLLPDHIVARGTLRGNEYAWPVADIPTIIDEAKAANLLHIGGQLQFRIPDGATCECYWVDVDTGREVSGELPWVERVSAAAKSATCHFTRLRNQYNFVAEGRSAFREHLQAFEDEGGDINDALCSCGTSRIKKGA